MKIPVKQFFILCACLAVGVVILAVLQTLSVQPVQGRLRDNGFMPPCFHALLPHDPARCKRDGINVATTPEGRQEWLYKDGKPDGVSRFYHPDGKLRMERTYEAGEFLFARDFDEQGKPKDGMHIEKYDGSDKVHLRKVYADGLLQSLVRYYRNGKPEREIFYKDGVTHGEMRLYYKSGQLATRIPWYEGRVVGSIKRYYKDGVLKEEEVFVDGKKARIKKYDERGRLVADDPYTPPPRYPRVDPDQLDFNGVGEAVMFVGDWEVSASRANGLDWKGGDRFLKMKSNFHFSTDGSCEIYSFIKGRKRDVVRKRYRINDGRLILSGGGEDVSLQFAFLNDGRRLALKSEHVAMVLLRK